MSISLADVVKPTIGFQGALQGAATANRCGDQNEQAGARKDNMYE